MRKKTQDRAPRSAIPPQKVWGSRQGTGAPCMPYAGTTAAGQGVKPGLDPRAQLWGCSLSPAARAQSQHAVGPGAVRGWRRRRGEGFSQNAGLPAPCPGLQGVLGGAGVRLGARRSRGQDETRQGAGPPRPVPGHPRGALPGLPGSSGRPSTHHAAALLRTAPHRLSRGCRSSARPARPRRRLIPGAAPWARGGPPRPQPLHKFVCIARISHGFA